MFSFFASLAAVNTETMIVDCAALFLLGGIVINTEIYRNRGRLSDRLFFALTITNIVLASADAISYSASERPEIFFRSLVLICFTVFSLSLQLWSFLFLMFFYSLTDKKKNAGRYWKLISLPALASMLMILANIPFHFLCSVSDTGEFSYGRHFRLIFVVPAIYLVIFAVRVWKINKAMVLFFVILLALGIGVEEITDGLSSTGFLLATALSSAHICVMNESFYNKEVSG